MATSTPADTGTTYVICEGQADAVLIDRLLIPPFSREHVRVLAANGLGMAVPLARTLLTTTPARVAVVVDVNADIPIRGDIEMALADVADGSRWEVFLFAPSVERLAADPAAVAAVAGRQLTDVELAGLAADPAGFLKAFATSRQERYPAFLDQLARRIAAGSARGDEAMQSLVRFIDAAPTGMLAHAG